VASLDPAALVVLALVVGLYVRAVLGLGRRGVRVPRGQQAAWYGGIALVAAGLLGPVDALSEELLTAHMAQHLLIADLGAPLLVAGLRTPVLQWFAPRPVLTAVARRRRLRRALAVLRRPPVAIALWVLVLYGWHFEPLFEAALVDPAVHALQHQSFVAGSVLVWWVALEPSRRRLRGELWKIGHVLGARLAGMFLGMAFITMRSPLYAPHYDGARGLSALHDQQIAGGLMLSLDVLVMLFAVGFFFWRAGQDHDRAEAAAGPDMQPAARG
jgi:cytochrome c oxidase assembly factor CtaG